MQIWNEDKFDDFMLLLTIISFIILISIILITVIKVCSGKVYLEVSNGNLIFNGIFSKECMSISNINTITRATGHRQLVSIIILSKPDKDLNQSKIIRFLLIWFSDRDIDYFFEYLSKINKKIEWIDFIGFSNK